MLKHKRFIYAKGIWRSMIEAGILDGDLAIIEKPILQIMEILWLL